MYPTIKKKRFRQIVNLLKQTAKKSKINSELESKKVKVFMAI
jgi:hypothetical protein